MEILLEYFILGLFEVKSSISDEYVRLIFMYTSKEGQR